LIRPISRPLFLLFEFRTVPKKGKKKKEKIVIQKEIETNEISTRSTQSGKRAYAESHEFVQFVHLKG
jgi:DNA-binding winged helix-turn-helix (wHTH) protein